MGAKIKLKKTDRGEIVFRSYCMESGEVGDWLLEPYCEKCGSLGDDQIDWGNSGDGMTEAWYIPACRLCGHVLPQQQKIEKIFPREISVTLYFFQRILLNTK